MRILTCIFGMTCLLAASSVQPSSQFTDMRGRIVITVATGAVFVRPSPLNVSDDCEGWLCLERSTNLLFGFQEKIDCYYGNWENFELKDTRPPSGISIYRVIFLGDL